MGGSQFARESENIVMERRGGFWWVFCDEVKTERIYNEQNGSFVGGK